MLDSEHVRFVLEALSSNSYSKVLAEPNLVTLNGHPAFFLAGGEFAVPVFVTNFQGEVAAASSTFRSFGTQLTFTPTILDKDRIRLQVTPSLSSINEENTVAGIPGLNSRSVATTVDLREGQWLAIAGLLLDEQIGSKSRVPFLGDIPVLDAFFSSKQVQREETELLVLVSPELVHPLEAEEAPSILPGMEVTEPNDCDFFVGGYEEGDPNCDFRSTVWPLQQRAMLEAHCEAKRQAHYQHTENYFIQGATVSLRSRVRDTAAPARNGPFQEQITMMTTMRSRFRWMRAIAAAACLAILATTGCRTWKDYYIPPPPPATLGR